MLLSKNTAVVVRTSRARRFSMRVLIGVGAVALAVIGPSPARADFVNGGFEAPATGDPNQPFGGWIVEYQSVNATMWNSAPATGQSAAQIVSSATFGTSTKPALCPPNMAMINRLHKGGATRIFQEVQLVAADFDSCGTATVHACWMCVFDHPKNGLHNRHKSNEQPFFAFTLTHNGGVVSSTAVRSGDATKPQSGWFAAGNGPRGKLWFSAKCVSLVLHHAQVGDTIRLGMEVRDCTRGDHGAMAFLDCVRIVPGPPAGPSHMFPFPQRWSAAVTSSLGQEVGDFNADGKSDLVDYLPASSRIRVLEASPLGTFFLPPTLPAAVPNNWTRLYTGDFDADSCSDVAGWDGTNLRFVWADCITPITDFDLTQTTMPVPGGVGAGGRFWVGDFDGDGRSDMARDTGGGIQVALATGNRVAPLAPFTALPNWRSSGSTIGGFYVCDFNADGKSDLMQSLPTGLHFLISTGSAFSPLAKWRPEGPPTGGWSVGDFDCDGRCELIRWDQTSRNSGLINQPPKTGQLRLLDIVPPPLNTSGGLFGVTSYFARIQAGPFAVGDFDGNGQDDLAHVLPGGFGVGSGVEVILACSTGCKCMSVHVEPICDYPDRTSQFLKITINNHSGGPLELIALTAGGGITFAPSTVILSPPLQNRRSRTITVRASGLTPNTQACVNLFAFRDTISDAAVCSQSACFRAARCDCMDLLSTNVYCNPDGSGTTCFDFSVRNAGTATAKFIRLSPPASFQVPDSVSPDLIPVNLLVSQTYTSPPCSVLIIPNGSNSLNFQMALLDAGMNVICFEDIGVDLPSCDVFGECCVTNIGIQTTTAIGCALLHGSWNPPGISEHCPWGNGNGSQQRLLLPRINTYTSINEEQRTFIAQRTGEGDPAADFVTTAASEIAWPMDAIDPRSPIGSGVSMLLAGAQKGADGSSLGDLTVFNNDVGFYAAVDFAGAGASDITVIGEGLDSYPPFGLPFPDTAVYMDASPNRVRALLSDFPGTTHGFVLEFDELTIVEVGVGTVMEVCELRVLSGGSPPVSHLTSVGFRGVNQPIIALGLIDSTNTPCPGDLTSDCVIDQEDVDVFNTYAASDAPLEVDVNGDGVVDINDLFVILSGFGTTCPCGVPPPSPCPGDANADGNVNFADVTYVLSFYNTVYPGGTGLGDGNLSGDVNMADITAVLTNWASVCR